jgi:diguanylate cyclase (GGDEF)-like protein
LLSILDNANLLFNLDTAYASRGLPLPGVTLSVGVAQYPVHGRTVDGLIRAADRALYAAKKAGRDRIEVAAPPSS